VEGALEFPILRGGRREGRKEEKGREGETIIYYKI
jgi:hypothetical protein